LNWASFFVTDGASQTLFSDSSADTLTGGSGQDLFFADVAADEPSVLDKITSQTKTEYVFETDLT
jgi:Ca2+-binding RTX toxin-like protein